MEHDSKAIKSIEVCHLYLTDSPPSRLVIDYHIDEARKITTTTEGSIIILVDDQHLRRLKRSDYFPLLHYLCNEVQADFISFETDLFVYTNDWLKSQSNMQELGKVIKKKYNGIPQCSHYIAIWYLLRLGYIQDTHNKVLNISNKYPSFVGSELVSVLSENNRPYEEQTESEIFAFCKRNLTGKITRVYYPEPGVANG